jgi:hypothetical protein
MVATPVALARADAHSTVMTPPEGCPAPEEEQSSGENVDQV